MTTDKTKIAILGTPGFGKTALLDAILKAAGLDPDQRVILVSPHEATPGNAIFLQTKGPAPYLGTDTLDAGISARWQGIQFPKDD